ncbi:MAG: hypothetical protein QOH10_1513, partial [Actinomycetota bacterium]|nr:hypothetical protein [Actinomycetota bacterium]
MPLSLLERIRGEGRSTRASRSARRREVLDATLEKTRRLLAHSSLECRTRLVRCERMFDTITSTRAALQGLARDFEPGTLTGEQAVRVVEDLGVIHRLIEGLLAMAAKRVADTSAHQRNGDRDAA